MAAAQVMAPVTEVIISTSGGMEHRLNTLEDMKGKRRKRRRKTKRRNARHLLSLHV